MARLGSIQNLRALAALMVAFGHLQHEALTLPAARAGGFTPVFLGLSGVGVDLFFVISGFVMVYASRALFGQPGAASTFLARRVARIVPLYWLMTTVFVGTLLAAPSALSTAMPGLWDIARSYLFLPYVQAGTDLMQPVFKLGWTLNYEMFFYVCFAIMIAASARIAVGALALVFVALIGLGGVLAPAPGLFRFWSDPILLEFIFGALIGLAGSEGRGIRQPLATLMVIAGIGALVLGDWLGLGPYGFARPLIWGLPAAAILAGLALGDGQAGPARSSLMTKLGDASYVLYLVHPLVIRALRILWDKSGQGAALSPWLFVMAGLAILIPASLLIHRFFEKPMTEWAQRRVAGARAPHDARIEARMAAILARQTGEIGKAAGKTA